MTRAIGLEEAQEAGCFDADAVRLGAFGKVGAELFLERLSDDMALVRLHIGHLSFGIGQPRNGLEAASVMRTFRDALTDLLSASYAQGREDACVVGSALSTSAPNVAELAKDIKAAINELAEGRAFPDLLDAVDALAALKASA